MSGRLWGDECTAAIKVNVHATTPTLHRERPGPPTDLNVAHSLIVAQRWKIWCTETQL